MKLMQDTGSLINWLSENDTDQIRVGLPFSELMWTDRHVWVITRVESPRRFFAKHIQTKMECWQDGYEHPQKNEDGTYKTYGDEVEFRKPRKYWKKYDSRVHLSFGSDTGYTDPSF